MAISINGTTGISGVDGSAGTPALQGTDTNTGIAFGSDVIIGSTGGTERFRCDSSGRMLVGTTTGHEKFHVKTGTNQNFLVGGPQSLASGNCISAVNDTNTVNVPLEIRGTEVKINAQSSDSINLATNDTTRLRIAHAGSFSAVVPSGGTLYPAFFCRAWVNFDGTGTVAIRNNGNVSSITDNGTGDYTINFGTAMPDANYSTVFGSAHSFNATNGDQGWANLQANNGGTDPQQAGSVRVWTSSKTSALGSAVDNATVNVAIFR